MTGDCRRLNVGEREQAIFRLLRDQADGAAGATVPQIHRQLTETGTRVAGTTHLVRDTVTLPVYYKLVRRLVSTGHLVELDGDGADGQRYALAPHLHADTALTLDDLRELADEPPSEAIARLVEAREHMWAQRDTVLRTAATALRTVDPRALVEEMVVGKAEAYNADVEAYLEEDGTDELHRRRLRAQRADLEQTCYRWFGLSHEAVLVPPASGGEGRPVVVDRDVLRAQLARRVYGETVIGHVLPENESAPDDWSSTVVAGSDGSTYASVMQVDTAAAFADAAGSEVVTFNNSAVFVRMEGELARQHPSPWYSVPLSRSAIDSPRNAGMVMAPFMYRNDGLNESEYEHMAKCATDVVQWRADEEVFRGHARSLGDGQQLPAPRVHFRDGTVTLQERESHHYQRTDPYGDMVREGVRLSQDVLRHLRDRRQPPVFAGAVKSSQLHLFATVVNWFVAKGHPAGGVPPADPNWDMARGSLLADNEAMSLLLTSLDSERAGGYFVTFVVVRPFHALTDLHRHFERERPDYWTDKFLQRQANHRADPMLDSYWKTVDAVEDDPYVRMLELADYALFYVGHARGDPAPLAPRYEFLEAIRTLPPDEAAKRVRRNVELIVAALHRTGFSLDQEHNFMSRKRLVKHVPFVVYEAHEKCKALGRALETELKSMVIQNLRRLRLARFGTPDEVRFRPVPIRAYIDRWRAALRDRELGAGEGGEG